MRHGSGAISLTGYAGAAGLVGFGCHCGILDPVKYDVLIIGAGLNGMSLALALAGAGRQVAVLDARAAPAAVTPAADAPFDTRIYAIGPASAAWLDVPKVWNALDPSRIAPVYDMQVYGDSARDQVPSLGLSAYRAGIGELCTIVEERELARVLASAAQFAARLTIFRPATAERLQLDADAARVVLADGSVLEADLVVAADGARSWARAAAGIAVDTIDYRQTAIVANFECARPHHNCAAQWFRRELGGGSGILAYLPLPGRKISIVWSVATDEALRLTALDMPLFAERVAAAGMDWLGALVPAGARAAFNLVNQRARQLAAPRFALVGDAAHVLHPLAGQGLNLGFGDCAELFARLQGVPDCGDVRVLRAYERARKAALADMHFVTHGLARLFGSPHPALTALRNMGLNLAGRLPVLPQLIVRAATGG